MKYVKWKRQWLWVGLIFVIETLLFGVAVNRCVSKERYYRSYQEITGVPVDEVGVPLPRGNYQITVYYVTQEHGVYCQMSAETSHGLYYGEEVSLPMEQNQKTVEFDLCETTDRFSMKLGSHLQANPGIRIKSVTVQETRRMDTRNCFLLLCLFVLADLLLIAGKKRILEHFDSEQKQIFFGLILIAFFASIPLFVNYLIGEQDLSFHLMRIEGIAEGLAAGNFPVRIQGNWLNGYGYPVSVLYGDLLLYFPAALRLVGFTLQDAYKIYIFFINVITAVTAYYAVRHMTENRKIALVGAGLYTLSIYRILNIYQRSAVGEYSAMAYFPLVFVGLHLLFCEDQTKRKKGVPCLVIGYTAILQSHCLSFEMIIIFSVVYILIHPKRFWKNILLFIGTGIVSVLLNLSFLVPFADYMLNQDMAVESSRFGQIMQEQGIFVAQLFQIFTYGGKYSQPLYAGIREDMPLTVGLPLMLVLLLFLWEVLFYGRQLKTENGDYHWREQLGLAIMMVFSLVMSCWFFPWEAIEEIPVIGKSLTIFQFAWRFLAVGAVTGALLGGYVIRNLGYIASAEWKKIVVAGLSFLTLLGSVQMMSNLMTMSEAKTVTGTDGINSIEVIINGEYLPKETDKYRLVDNQFYPGEGVELYGVRKDNDRYILSVANTSRRESQILVPYLAYKGYVAIDCQSQTQMEIQKGEDAIIEVILPAGYQGDIEVYFREPVTWRAAEVVSLLTLLILIVVMVGKRKHKDRL